jgi:hypothetical protein
MRVPAPCPLPRSAAAAVVLPQGAYMDTEADLEDEEEEGGQGMNTFGATQRLLGSDGKVVAVSNSGRTGPGCERRGGQRSARGYMRHCISLVWSPPIEGNARGFCN